MDEGNVSLSTSDRSVMLLGLVVGAVPFAITSSSQSFSSVNGQLTSFTYRDNIALGGGAVAAVCGIVALILALKNKTGIARIAAAVGVLALGGIQIARGVGVFAERPIVQDHSLHTDIPEPPKEAEPKQCADGKACDQEGVALVKSGKGPEAMKVLARGCELGGGAACFDAGVMLGEGIGVAKDPAKAAVLYDKACTIGHPDACMNLGVQYQNGIGVAKDEPKAVTLFAKGCEAGTAMSCSNLGIVTRDGIGLKADMVKAREAFAKACDGKYGAGCEDLGLLYVKDKSKAEQAKAAAAFEKGCDVDEMQCCTDLGLAVEHGQNGAKKDLAKAKALFEKACDKDHAGGCNNLATMYEDGQGMKKDKAKAKELYDKACKAGLELACKNLKLVK